MKMKKRLLFPLSACIAIFLITASAWPGKAPVSNSVHLRGSGAILPIAQAVAEAYMKEHPDRIITVTGGGSARGIKAVVDGTANIGMVSSNITGEASKQARERGIIFNKYTVAYDALVPVVNPRNPVSNLSMEQLKKIYSGEVANWKQVGGRDAPIVVVSLDVTSGSFEGWKNMVMGRESVLIPTACVFYQIVDARRHVAENINAIGYIALILLDGKIKAVSVNGIDANKQTLQRGAYPLTRTLNLYTTNAAPENVINFIKYFLDPEKGQQHVQKAGAIPVGQFIQPEE